MNATVTMGKQGRLVIPAGIRGELGLAPGDQLHLRLAGTRLVIERPGDAVAELRQVAAAIPPTRSLVEELLLDRRAEIALE
jgi:AbrB family looped-hinge helix DNA binding protein